MTGKTRTIGTVSVALIILIILSGIASASVDIDYKKGKQIISQPVISGVKEVRFIAECDGVMTISSTENRIDILSSCDPRNFYVDFIVPNDRAVYQTKDTTGKKVAIRVLQKRVSVSTDGKYNIILTKPESIGRFEFMGDLINQNDDFVVENAADQSIKANIKTIDIETIKQKDTEFYNSLQSTNLSSVDQDFYKRIKGGLGVLETLISDFRNMLLGRS